MRQGRGVGINDEMEEQPLGENVDKDPAWPATAVYTQAEKASRSKGWPER